MPISREADKEAWRAVQLPKPTVRVDRTCSHEDPHPMPVLHPGDQAASWLLPTRPCPLPRGSVVRI